MEPTFSDRIADVPQSFIREILKVTVQPSIISFAGGLPNRALFPVEALRVASDQLFREAGPDILQYSNSEGYAPLRAFLAERYRAQHGLDISVDNILITTGSQQGLDLLGKTLLNDGDSVAIEEPGYLGAIQAFALYRPRFQPIPLSEEGLDVDVLSATLREHRPKLLYTVPNFQNPSGISYGEANRIQIAESMAGSNCYLIQDDPYGELRFAGRPKTSFAKLLPKQTILFGSFSKTVAPSLRIGWLVAPDRLMEKLIIAKQASDLHTNYFGQRLIERFVRDHDLDAHIASITEVYGRQKNAMSRAIRHHLPSVRHTEPEGGMFLWITLPDRMSSMELFHRSIARDVAFVPGTPFYTAKPAVDTLRLNFSCVDERAIDEGVQRIALAVNG